jgi:hypothetical protein
MRCSMYDFVEGTKRHSIKGMVATFLIERYREDVSMKRVPFTLIANTRDPP